MTYDERAEKIAAQWWKPGPLMNGLMFDIAAEIRKAEEKAHEAGREQGAFECCHAKDIARAAALEEAAKIAEANKHIGPFDDSPTDRLAVYSNRTCEIIAECIRALAKEIK